MKTVYDTLDLKVYKYERPLDDHKYFIWHGEEKDTVFWGQELVDMCQAIIDEANECSENT